MTDNDERVQTAAETEELLDARALIARVCWEALRTLRAAQARQELPIGPPWTSEGILARAEMIGTVRQVLDGATAEQLHENWVVARAKDGWLYGETEDPVLKTSPLLVDYTLLPQEQKECDALVEGIVHALAGPRGIA